MDNEHTSAEVASAAGRIMAGYRNVAGFQPSAADIKSVAASALTQTADVPGLPVKGYKPTQTPEAIAVANRFKELEERVLREIDDLSSSPGNPPSADARLLAIGRTQLQGAFMFLARSIFQPQRIALPEDAIQRDFTDK